MCRFTAYIGQEVRLSELLLTPDHSIVRQSYAAREGKTPTNGDGFGVGWYDHELDPAPALYRNVRPAWTDHNIAQMAPRIATSTFFAHVRGATPGIPVQDLNCHPFVSGRLMFMHNGSIGAHRRVIRRLRQELPEEVYFSIQGSTDSEHAFALVRHALGKRAEDPSPEDLADATRQAIQRLEALREEEGDPEDKTVANFALTDGRSLVAARYATPGHTQASLYMGSAREFTCSNGGCKAHGPGENGSVLLSSEQLWEEDTAWHPVPESHLVIVDPELNVRVEPLGLT